MDEYKIKIIIYVPNPIDRKLIKRVNKISKKINLTKRKP